MEVTSPQATLRAEVSRGDAKAQAFEDATRVPSASLDLPAAAYLIAMVGLWWAVVEIFKIPAYLLPGPKAVFARLIADAGLLWTHSQVTLTEIVLGFGITIVTAIPLGLLIALSPLMVR